MLWLFLPQIVIAKGDGQGSVRARLGWLGPDNLSTAFLLQGRLHLSGEFRFSNRFKSQAHFLAGNSYEGSLSFKKSLKIYPSISWLINEDLQLNIGRNLYESPFPQIVSLNDYEPFFYTFDGVFLEYSARLLNVNLWSAHLPDRWIAGKRIPELKYGFGFFVDVKSEMDYIDYISVHAAYLGDSFLKERASKMSRYGLGIEGTIVMDLDYTFVAIGHGQGLRFKWEENMLHFLLSYSYPDFLNSRFFAGYHKDSQGYNPWLYNRHENAGLMDIFLWGNLTYYFLGLSGSAKKLFDFQVSFYDLSQTEKQIVPVWGYFGSLIQGKGLSDSILGPNNLGKEVDIQLKTQIQKNFELSLLAGFFTPRLKIQEFFAKDNFYSNVQLTGFYKF